MLVKQTAKHPQLNIFPWLCTTHTQYSDSLDVAPDFLLLLAENDLLQFVKSHRADGLVSLHQEVGLGAGVSRETPQWHVVCGESLTNRRSKVLLL